MSLLYIVIDFPRTGRHTQIRHPIFGRGRTPERQHDGIIIVGNIPLRVQGVSRLGVARYIEYRIDSV